jgi:dTDP-glucose 4,6-dehydratase
MDNFLTGSPRNLEHLAGKTRFRFMEQDITQPFSIDGPVDYVVNMASPASPKAYASHCASSVRAVTTCVGGNRLEYRTP